jgi:hypothetical protein
LTHGDISRNRGMIALKPGLRRRADNAPRDLGETS